MFSACASILVLQLTSVNCNDVAHRDGYLVICDSKRQRKY